MRDLLFLRNQSNVNVKACRENSLSCALFLLPFFDPKNSDFYAFFFWYRFFLGQKLVILGLLAYKCSNVSQPLVKLCPALLTDLSSRSYLLELLVCRLCAACADGPVRWQLNYLWRHTEPCQGRAVCRRDTTRDRRWLTHSLTLLINDISLSGLHDRVQRPTRVRSLL